MIDVLCVGHAAYDLTFAVPHHPAPDEKAFATSLTSCGGGPAANAAVTVAKLGGCSAFAGYLGQDIYGDLHLAELQEAGVDTTLVVRGTSPTPLSVIWAKPDGQRSLVNYRGETRPLSKTSEVFRDVLLSPTSEVWVAGAAVYCARNCASAQSVMLSRRLPRSS